MSTSFVQHFVSLVGDPILASFVGGLVGGLAQAVIMTPTGLIFLSLNLRSQKSVPESSDISALTIFQQIYYERGIVHGLYAGLGAVCLRQSSNWATRSCMTEIARRWWKMKELGIFGEFMSGILGGVASCWNTPIEVARVLIHRDICEGRKVRSCIDYLREIHEREGKTPVNTSFQRVPNMR